MLSFLRTGHHIWIQQFAERAVAGQYPIADDCQMKEADLQKNSKLFQYIDAHFPQLVLILGLYCATKVHYDNSTVLASSELLVFCQLYSSTITMLPELFYAN